MGVKRSNTGGGGGTFSSGVVIRVQAHIQVFGCELK